MNRLVNHWVAEEKATNGIGHLADLVAALEAATERGDLGAIIEGVAGLRRLVRDAGEPARRWVTDITVGEVVAGLDQPGGPAPEGLVWSALVGVLTAAVFGGHLRVSTRPNGSVARERPVRGLYADGGVIHIATA